MLGGAFLEEAGFRVNTADLAAKTMDKPALVSGGLDPVIGRHHS